MAKQPLKMTDRRRRTHTGEKVQGPASGGGNGSGAPLARLFNDRRHPNGSGKRSS